MTDERDFNNLNVWLTDRLEERRLSVNDLARLGRMSATVIYMWLRDHARPGSTNVGKVVKVLSEHPAWEQDRVGRWQQVMKTVTYEEMVQQFTERQNGRPKGSGGGPRAVTTRGRK